MAEIAPFRALRFDPAVVGDVGALLAPPYDVISPGLQEELYARSPHNIVRVELGREPEEVRYRRARETLAEWHAQGVLARDREPALYLHEHRFVHRGRELSRRGIFCALRLVEWEHGAVRPHERTFSGPKLDRLRVLRETGVNTSTVFLLYDDAGEAMARALDEAEQEAPLLECRVGGEAHRLWRVPDGPLARRVVDAVRPRRLYVADGHHRYETALEHRRERPEADATLAYLVATQDPGLLILPTHRVVRGRLDVLERAARAAFEVAPVDAGALEDQQPPVAIAREGRVEALTPRPEALGALPEAWRELAVAQAEELLLRPLVEAGAEVAYTHDMAEALAATHEGAAAVLLRPVDAETLVRVADAGERLPQKTTYFHPKVPTGLVLRPLS